MAFFRDLLPLEGLELGCAQIHYPGACRGSYARRRDLEACRASGTRMTYEQRRRIVLLQARF